MLSPAGGSLKGAQDGPAGERAIAATSPDRSAPAAAAVGVFVRSILRGVSGRSGAIRGTLRSAVS